MAPTNLFGVHRHWQARRRRIYRYEWVGGDLEPVRHLEPVAGTPPRPRSLPPIPGLPKTA